MPSLIDLPFTPAAVRTNFNRAAASYDTFAILAHTVCERLLSCMDFMRLQPTTILDLGAGTGYGSELLAKRYPVAQLIMVDSAEKMLHCRPLTVPCSVQLTQLCAAAEQLPLENASIDFVFANLLLPWCPDPDLVLTEMYRVLKPGGLLMFSTFGPDTLHELRASWAAVDAAPHVHIFFDLHDVGDVILRAGFADPVMDRELITFTYQHLSTFFKDLKNTGFNNLLTARRRTLTGRRRFQQFSNYYEGYRYADGKLPATYEITYGHAWKTAAPIKKEFSEIRIAIEQIRGRNRR